MSKQQCRCCLTKANLLNIYSKKQKPMIYKKIMKLTKVRVHPDDGLPGNICSSCLLKLNECIEFINICEASEVQLKENNRIEYVLNSVSNTEHYNDKFNNKNEIFKSIPQLEFKKSVLDDEDMDINNLMTQTEDTKSVLSIRTECTKSSTDKKIEKQQCFTCGKVMSSRFRLKTHLRTHTGERPFSCPHCSKNFSLAQNLKIHLRTHTGEKPLQCTVCGESFAQSAGLAAHKRKHTGQTPYRCILCPRSFRTIGHLQYHTRRHTGEKNFECDTCGRAFITRSDLKQHLLTHTGERPHECSTCGLRLTRSSHLKRHILHMHNGLNPFVCTECPTTFTNKWCLEKHKKEHHMMQEIVDKKSVS